MICLLYLSSLIVLFLIAIIVVIGSVIAVFGGFAGVGTTDSTTTALQLRWLFLGYGLLLLIVVVDCC